MLDFNQMASLIEQVVRFVKAKEKVSGELNVKALYETFNLQIAPFLKDASDPIACRKGCSYCCHLKVAVIQEEGTFLMSKIHEEDPNKYNTLLKKAITKHKQTKGLTDNEVVDLRSPCVFLENNECSVYEDRPLSCRGMYVTDVNMCKDSYDKGVGQSTAFHATPILIKDFIIIAVASYKSGKSVKSILNQMIAEDAFNADTLKGYNIDFISLEESLLNYAKQ